MDGAGRPERVRLRNVCALGTLGRTEYEHGGDGRDHEARDHGRDRAELDHGDADEHANDIGDEPGDPHGGAQAMEGALAFEGGCATALTLEVDERRPASMEEHEQDRGEPGDAVDRGAASALVRAMMDIRVVPVVSQARPSQNKTTWGPRRLPSARSLKTPMV